MVACNEAARISRCVRSLASLCGEVLVLDSGSTDGTQAIASEAGARVIDTDWPGFAAQKNRAIAAASTPWVLLLDADEWLDAEGLAAIRQVFAQVLTDDYDAFSLPRINHFGTQRIRFGSWGSEQVVRLMRQHCRYADMRVHERLELDGLRVGKLAAPLMHESVQNLEEYRAKLRRYAALSAEEMARRGKHARWSDLWLRPGFHFFKNVILRGGFLDGRTGVAIEKAYASYVHEKYRLLREG